MKKIFFILLSFIFFTNIFYSQVSSCPNSDFESGTLSGWQGKTGNCCPINTTTFGIVSGRHTIMTGTGTDPNTCDVVHVVAPGGSYSARLGNDSTGSEAESLIYTVTVTPSSTLFIYKYAVVLEDPGHSAADQPRFQVRILNTANQLIDPTCGVYTVAAAAGLSGFSTCNNGSEPVRYRDWTTVGLDLTPYLGQTIKIQFDTGDCALGAHYGYAYVDAYCSPLQIGATFCINSFAAQLTAPIGFTYLWNTGETTQSIIVNNPTVGLTYSCQLTSVTGCTVNISTVLQLENPLANFTLTNTCYNNVIFTDTTQLINTSLIDTYTWNFGDGSPISHDHNPTHIYSAPGTYNVSFTISNALGCSNTINQTVTVIDPPTAQISYSNSNYCTSDTAIKTLNFTGTGPYQGGAFTVSPTGLNFDTTTNDINPSLSTPGNYTVTYTIPTFNNCTVIPVTATVNIYQSPQATISYSNSSYCNQITFPEYVFLTGVGNYSGGTYSATPSGLSLDTNTGNFTPSTSTAGTYTVTYTTPVVGGVCSSITTSTQVTIVAAPTAILTYGTPFCDSVTSPQSITLTGTGVFNTGTFSSTPSGLSLNTSTGSIIPSQSTPGNYNLNYLIPASGGCNAFTVSTIVTITHLPSVSIQYADPFCKSLTTPQPVQYINGTAAYLGGIFTAPTGVTINSSTGGITPSTSDDGIKQITYTMPSIGGCTPAPITTNVRINPLPNPSLSNAVICEDPHGFVFRPTTLDTGLSNSGFSCQWSLNGTIIPNQTQNTLTVNTPGTYTALVTNNQTGCIAPAASCNISTAVTVEDFNYYITDTFTQDNVLTINIQGGTGPFLYSVDNGAYQYSNIFSHLLPGIHSININDVNNCTDVTKNIIILGYPKFFTPNGDGINDNWNIFYFDNKPNAKIYIYDRYGKFIKELSPIGEGWDGTYNGQLLPSSDYWFVVEYYDYDATGNLIWQVFKSHFSLKR